MKVELAVTRSCRHRALLETELKRLGIPCSIRYVEEDEEFQKKHAIKGSPNILVDGKLVFRGMPAISDLEAYFKEK